MPSHSHALVNGTANVTVYTTESSGNEVNESDGGNNGLSTGGSTPAIYQESPTTADHVGGVVISGSTANSGGSQAFDIRNPYLGIYVSIAMQGIFPSRN